MSNAAGNRQDLATGRVGRRGFIKAASGLAVTFGVTACGGGGGSRGEPTATVAPLPTATQDVISSPVAGYGDPAKWAGRTLSVACWGGDYQEAQKLAIFTPFEESTGVSIQIKQADLGRIKSQIEDEEVTTDLLTVPTEDVLNLARENYLTAIDYKVVDATALFDDIVQQYAVGLAYFSTIIVFPTGSSSAPQNWESFWDVPPVASGEKPEPQNARALHKSPIGTLEFALLADGVARDELYPLDVDRAFLSLDKIRASVVDWYEDGKQPVELVVAGQAGMASAWNVRAAQLQVTEEIRVQWYDGMLSADSWVVPRGAPNTDVAMDLINYSTRATPNANFSRLVPYGPVNPESLNLLRPDRLAILPSSAPNRSVQFVENFNWWSDNKEALTERFNEWLLNEPKAPEGSPTASDSG
jgi:putative spermidine/putrescine transport system substrate-binding protein